MNDLKKNFILLSAIAKEKKYAQEYLGLLARRGDIGSIRIGKRWYTKMEWFSEFLADAEARKMEIKNFGFSEKSVKEKIKQKKENALKGAIPFEEAAKHQIKVIKPLEICQEKSIGADNSAESLQIVSSAPEEPIQKKSGVISLENEKEKIILPRIIKPKLVSKKYFVVKKKFKTINLKANMNAKPISQRVDLKTPKMKKPASKKENRLLPVENSVIVQSWTNKTKDLSPNFSPISYETGFFPKFAFAISGVLLLVLLIQFGWAYKDELKRIAGINSGFVAGAESTKINLTTLKNYPFVYFESQGEKAKENISLSRVLLKAAIERSADSEHK